ncbi:unnamed protein product [Sphagnum jensenii]|uniref:Uncharacterized protein n=1 Tax=Sphagnum jensenii TaxID=128206 RepID=A0ABP1AD28_9BRYO
MAAEPGSLMAAILQHEQDAFSYTAAGRLKRGGRVPLLRSRVLWQFIRPVLVVLATKLLIKDHGPQVRHLWILRLQSNPVKFNQFTDTVVSGLCELLDEFFERTEAPGEDEGEEAGTFLSLPEIRSIAEDVVKLRAKNLIQNVPVEYLVRLLSLLDRHVQRSHEREVDDSDDVDAENFTMVMSALESVQISLMIMTGPGMAKQIYKEELIDHLIDFSRYQIVHTIFPAYDALYHQIHKGAGAGEDEEEGDDYMDAPENGVGSAKKSRRKSKVSAKPKKTEANKLQSFVHLLKLWLTTLMSLSCLDPFISIRQGEESTYR